MNAHFRSLSALFCENTLNQKEMINYRFKVYCLGRIFDKD